MVENQENKNYQATYSAIFGSSDLGCWCPDSNLTDVIYPFQAINDEEALKTAKSQMHNVLRGKRGAFYDSKTATLDRLIECREISLPK